METLKFKIGDLVIPLFARETLTPNQPYMVERIHHNTQGHWVLTIIDDAGITRTCKQDKYLLHLSAVEPEQASLPIEPTPVIDTWGEPKAAQIVSDGGSTSYYELPAWATELRHLMTHKKMTPNIANIFKACYRFGEKAGTDRRYDLNKIISMAQFELEDLDRAEGKL